MKKWIRVVVTSVLSIGILAGCTTDGQSIQSSNNVKKETSYVETDGIDSNSLVVYFSLAGEQYSVGVIEEGNTAIVAKMIADETGSDVFEIVPENPYPTVHRELLTVAENEQRNHERPAYIGDVSDFDTYDTIYFGYPIWWGDMPMIVYHFLESHDFTGKKLIPFVTHGGSGFAGTKETIEKITGVKTESGFAISGETAQNEREKTQEAVEEWLDGIGM